MTIKRDHIDKRKVDFSDIACGRPSIRAKSFATRS
jgi:hypothetical protein